jgi:peptide deformylase
MALMEITEFPERVLKEAGDPVERFDGDLERLAADMFETMYAAEGVGLAAPQVGLSLRLFVMDCEGVKLVAANPEILSAEGEQEGEEGCLSVGKIHAPLKRAARVRLRAQDLGGEWFEREAEGLAARCFLHETDHCDGTLFIDHLSPLRRDMLKRRFQKFKRWR